MKGTVGGYDVRPVLAVGGFPEGARPAVGQALAQREHAPAEDDVGELRGRTLPPTSYLVRGGITQRCDQRDEAVPPGRSTRSGLPGSPASR